jgi:hypothetical protein
VEAIWDGEDVNERANDIIDRFMTRTQIKDPRMVAFMCLFTLGVRVNEDIFQTMVSPS